MKTDRSTACGQQPRPTSSQMNLCLPFCGLGAEDYVQGRASSCGTLELEKHAPRAGELSDTITES